MQTKVRTLILLACLATTGAAGFAADGAPVVNTRFTYSVPASCHVTLVINDASGHRVRNLVSDVAVSAGKHTATWDGLDDNGRPVAPGIYRWRGLTRGDLHLVYRGCFTHGDPPWMYGKTGGWLADHYPPCAIVSWKDSLLIGSGVAEWGHGLVSCDLDGRKQWGVVWLSGKAWEGVASMATDGDRVFTTGFPGWGDNWVWEVNPATGESWAIVKIGPDANPKATPPIPDRAPPFDGPMGLRVVGARRTGPTRWDGEFYVSDILGNRPRTFVYSMARPPEASPQDTRGYYNGGNNKWYTAALLRVLPIRIWGMTWLPDGRCIAALDSSLAVIDTRTGATTPFVDQGLQAPYAITSDPAARVYVSDRGGQREWDNPAAAIRTPGLRTSPKASMQVKIFDSRGHFLAAIGREGGQQPGAFNPLSLDMPAGIAVDSRGRLWITEETATKRVSVWDIPADLVHNPPKLDREFFGPGAYGEGAYMLDPMHPNRITSGAAKITWDVDLAKQAFRPVELPDVIPTPGKWSSLRFNDDFPFGTTFESADGNNWFNLTHETFAMGGKTYCWYGDPVVGYGVVAEKMTGGDIKPLAAFGAVRNYVEQAGQYSNQWVPQAIFEAAQRLPNWPALAAKAGIDPNASDLPHKDGSWGKWPVEINFFNWTDANGDGKMQPDEITLHPLTASHGAPLVFIDHNLNALLSIDGRLFRMSPLEVTPVGAPLYDWSKAEPASLGSVGTPSAVFADGSELIGVPTDNVIRFVGADGKDQWTYPSYYHGHSHRNMDNQTSRVSVPGSVYGAWNVQGIVPGPGDLGQFFMLHAGHGVDYLMTTDGLFIGTLFKSIYQGSGEQSWENLPKATPGMLLDNVTLDDECFNGSIAQAGATVDGFQQGHYYLLGLGRRVIVELTGMDSVKRLVGGSVNLSPGVVKAARSAILAHLTDRWHQSEQGRVGSIPYAPQFAESLLDYSPTVESLPNHARVVLWHNDQGLGIAAILDYTQDTPYSQVFTNAATSWERDFAGGDTLTIEIGPDSTASTSAAWSNQRIAFAERNGKIEAVRYRWMRAAAAPVGARVLPDGRDGQMAWVADLIPVIEAGVDRSNPENWTTYARFHATIPWKTLGIDYAPTMRLRADVGYTRRLPGGAGVDRHYAVSDVGTASYNFATALALQPDLWRTFVLRPKGYVLPPRMGTGSHLDKGVPIVIDYQRASPPVVVAFGGATVSVSADTHALKLGWIVTGDSSPFVNGGVDWTLLFKSGDACDVQIESPVLGRCRYLIAPFKGKPLVIRYQFDAKKASADQGVTYRAGAGSFFVPIVEQLPIEPTVTRGNDWYSINIDLPWSVLQIAPKPGLSIPMELGLLRSDETGSTTISRTYWNSGLRGMVVDTPTEARPTTNWGTLKLK